MRNNIIVQSQKSWESHGTCMRLRQNLFLYTLANTVNSPYLLRDLASLAVPEDFEEVDVVQVRGEEKVIQLEKPCLFNSTHFLSSSTHFLSNGRRLFYW